MKNHYITMREQVCSGFMTVAIFILLHFLKGQDSAFLHLSLLTFHKNYLEQDCQLFKKDSIPKNRIQ